jgi:hypothetical protein
MRASISFEQERSVGYIGPHLQAVFPAGLLGVLQPAILVHASDTTSFSPHVRYQLMHH